MECKSVNDRKGRRIKGRLKKVRRQRKANSLVWQSRVREVTVKLIKLLCYCITECKSVQEAFKEYQIINNRSVKSKSPNP